MNKKEVLQGVIMGFLATVIGVFMASIFLGKLSGRSDSILEVLETRISIPSRSTYDLDSDTEGPTKFLSPK